MFGILWDLIFGDFAERSIYRTEQASGGGVYGSGPFGGAKGGNAGQPGGAIGCAPAAPGAPHEGFVGGGGGGVGQFHPTGGGGIVGGKGGYTHEDGGAGVDNSGAGGGGGGISQFANHGRGGKGGSGYIEVFYWDLGYISTVKSQMEKALEKLPGDIAQSEAFATSVINSARFDQAVKARVDAYLKELHDKGSL